MQILLANPRGFCAGVDRAIGIVDRALQLFPAPIYVRHEVVHNRFVVEALRQRGAVFVEELSEVPDDAVVIFSAHGVPKAVEQEAQRRGLKVFDATCPLVTKVHMEVLRHSQAGRECILIGHAGHPEVEGTLGRYEAHQQGGIYLVSSAQEVANLTLKDPEHVGFVTQTTLSMDDAATIVQALKQRFPQIQGPRKDDICYATQNRQDAVKQLGQEADLILVVGSPNSSNSNRLREIAETHGCPAYLIDNGADIDPAWLQQPTVVGITAGASAPESLVQDVIRRLHELGGETVTETEGREERIVFQIPAELRLDEAD